MLAHLLPLIFVGNLCDKWANEVFDFNYVLFLVTDHSAFALPVLHYYQCGQLNPS